MNKKLNKKIKKIKDDLLDLYSDFREDTLILQAKLEMGDIPKGLSKAQFKRVVGEQLNLLNRNAIDRVFLEKLEILETSKRKEPTKPKYQPSVSNIGKLANKIRSKEMSAADKILISEILKDLSDNLNK